MTKNLNSKKIMKRIMRKKKIHLQRIRDFDKSIGKDFWEVKN
jgi:hypothetical protein